MAEASHPVAARFALIAGLTLSHAIAFGQIAETPPPARRPQAVDDRDAARIVEKTRRENALREIERRVGESAEARRRLAAEVDAYRSDNASLSSAILATSARVQGAETRMGDLEGRLDTLSESQDALRRSIDGRRDTLAAILAAVQRLGRHAPPALLTRPEDVLAAMRGSMLLGSIVPGLQEETASLAGDLAELVRQRGLATRDREALGREMEQLAGERDRLAALLELRRDQLSRAVSRLGDERARSEALGQEATSVRELVDRLSEELAAARREAAAERERVQAERQGARERFAAAAIRDPARLAPAVPFADVRGKLTRPAVGPVVRDFGDPNGAGGVTRGIVIAPRAKAIVTAPCDGWISYSGPFRSFGRLLIINAGDGYNLVLAGMDRLHVETGQFVLAGEPVGQMGEFGQASAAMGAVEGGGPALYVEFRKDGGSIDPRPWWARSQGERVRG